MQITVSKTKEYLFSSAAIFLASSFLIVGNFLEWLPLGGIDFFLFLLVLLVLCWEYFERMMWLFVATIALETVIFTPVSLPFQLRFFQILGVALLLVFVFKKAQLIKDFVARRKFGVIDELVFVLLVLATTSILFSGSVQLAVVFASFVAFYFLVRINLAQENPLNPPLKKGGIGRIAEGIWFFLLGSVPVVFFSLYQAVAMRLGWEAKEVFVGRVNGSFTEPDWLGAYMVVIMALLFGLRLLFVYAKDCQIKVALLKGRLAFEIVWFTYFMLCFAVLFLTVARSAWLGFVVVFALYSLAMFVFLSKREEEKAVFKRLAEEVSFVLVAIALSILVVWVSGLSSFHFFNRATSSFSGMQKITISCKEGSEVGQQIGSVDELGNFGCRHINLEEIESEKRRGREVREVYRPDPNIDIRKNIYTNTWQAIKEDPFLPRGFGFSGQILGRDSAGSFLNASNIFLEIWLSMGLLGLLSFLGLLSYPIFVLGRNIWEIHKKEKVFTIDRIEFARNSLVILLIAAFVMPNLFNAGIFLGFFWVGLALISSWLVGVAPSRRRKKIVSKDKSKKVNTVFKAEDQKKIVELLEKGKVGILPTDTAYGISVKTALKRSVERIYRIKKRSTKKAMIIVISDLSQLDEFDIILNKKTKKLLAKVWPGRVSVLLSLGEEGKKKLSYLHRGTGKLAFRLPDYEFIKKVISKTGPLVSTSANISGKENVKNVKEARELFGKKLDFYVDDRELKGKTSTLIEITKKGEIEILREGADFKKIKKVI
jgi:L-threonylcarbamoyladenylate synthase